MPEYPTPFSGQLAQRGQYIGNYYPTNVTFIPTADIIYYVPIIIPYVMVLDLLGIHVGVAEAGKKCKLGIYPIERGYLGDLIVKTGEISLAVIGFFSDAFECALSPGAYVLAFVTNATGTAAIRECLVYTSHLAQVDGNAIAVYTHYQEALAYVNCLPTTPGTLTLSQGDCPRIIARLLS